MANKKIIREGVEDIDETVSTIPYRYSITAYGADYPVDGLVTRINRGDIVIPTFDPEVKLTDQVQGFQRGFIWTKQQCDRFIESLLLGLPVPGIFLVKQGDGSFLVLDGQQRLKTLEAFFEGILRGQEFTLENAQSIHKGRTYKSLELEDRRRLDDSIIHATIVRQDEPADDLSSIYLVFERLNTGGTSLQPQEIRVALYAGSFVQLLRELNELDSWRDIYGTKSKRLKDQELILRFFALFFQSGKYGRPMKDFLNNFIGENREFKIQSEAELKNIFHQTIETVHSALGKKAFRLKAALNAAVFDSVMVGVAHRISERGEISDYKGLKQAYDSLLSDPEYLATVERATADEESVRKRLNFAKKSMSKVR